MTSDNPVAQQRAQILSLTRRLLGVPYSQGAAVPVDGDAPVEVDCSSLVRWVATELYGTDARLSPGDTWPIARTMFAKLVTTSRPMPGDLAFYSREDAERGEVWHVMVVTEHGGVIGASDEAGRVHEYNAVHYSSRWHHRGFCSFPVDQ